MVVILADPGNLKGKWFFTKNKSGPPLTLACWRQKFRPSQWKNWGDEAVLNMWTTNAHLPQALRVMSSWGFKYKTVQFVWVKTKKDGKPVKRRAINNRKSCEICLLWTSGNVVKKHQRHAPAQLVFAPVTRHSEKPPRFTRKLKNSGRELIF